MRTIDKLTKKNNLAPTLQEIADVLQRSKITIREQVLALAEKRMLIHQTYRQRSMFITELGREYL